MRYPYKETDNGKRGFLSQSSPPFEELLNIGGVLWLAGLPARLFYA